MTTGRLRFIQVTAFVCVCGLAAFAWIHFPVYIDSAAAAENIVMKQKLFPTRKLDCPVDAILCGEEYFGEDAKRSDLNTLRSKFHRLMTTIDFNCPASDRFGRAEDGGYQACMTKAIRPDSNSCLVYSFGISTDWSFDESWAKYGCEVHSFDPSIGKQDHMHAPNVSFHNLGLWGNDYTNKKGWRLERLSTIRKRLGHEKRNIDALKIDVEGAEWPFLRDVTYADQTSLSNVRQLYIELHTPKFNTEKNMTASDFAEINDYISRLRDVYGFQLYKNVQNNYCCGRFSSLMPPGVPEKCCHEVFLFNPHLFAI
jgi:hypothetical protein